MNKTIQLTPAPTKWIFVLNGLLNGGLGARMLYLEPLGNWSFFLGVILVTASPLMVIYAILLFRPANSITPKVAVSDSSIIIKEDIFQKKRVIDWSTITQITFGSYEMKLLLNNSAIETINFQTSAKVSISIKEVIRQFATEKRIEVVGG